jgi:hypothetical protein
MNKSHRTLLIAGGAVFLAGCFCLAVIGLGWFGFSSIASRRIAFQPTLAEVFFETPLPAITIESSDEQGVSPEPPRTLTPTPEEEANPTPLLEDQSPLTEISPQTAEQMDEIEEQIEELRGLEPSGSVTRVLLTQTSLRQRVIDDFLEEYTQDEARDDALVLSAFGLLDSDFDLYELYLELYSEQTAGFYDDDAKEMAVIQGEGFQGYERSTYAHEYTHALQDQNYDFKNGLEYTDESCEEDSERCAAIQALIEGDASLSEIEWLTNFATTQDLIEYQQFYDSYESPVYDSSPEFLKEDFIFPYTYGLDFVEYLYNNGGWSGVDQAYGELPISTEQILHPEQYPEERLVQVDLPDLSGVLRDGWRELDKGIIGEWYTYLILAYGNDKSARLSEDEAKGASAGWGGDAYVVYANDSSNGTAMVLSTVWDTDSDAEQFVLAFQEFTSQRYGPPDTNQSDRLIWEDSDVYTALHIIDTHTIWILAPDLELGESIWDTINLP